LIKKDHSSKDEKNLRKMANRIKSAKQLSDEVILNVQALSYEYIQRVKNAVDDSDAYSKGTDRFHKDAIAELVRMGYDRSKADFIIIDSESINPNDALNHDIKTLRDYTSVLRTLAKKINTKLPYP
jgi:hypothetical protein